MYYPLYRAIVKGFFLTLFNILYFGMLFLMLLILIRILM